MSYDNNNDDSHINNIGQIEEFIKVAGKNKNNSDHRVEFECRSRKERYSWIDQTLGKFCYFSLPKKDKGAIRKFIETMTGISNSQLTRLIAKKKKVGRTFSDQSHLLIGKYYFPINFPTCILSHYFAIAGFLSSPKKRLY